MKRNIIKKFVLILALCLIISSMAFTASAIQVDQGGWNTHVVNGVSISSGEYLYQYEEATGQLVFELSSRPVLYDLYTDVKIEYTHEVKKLIFFTKRESATDEQHTTLADWPTNYRVFETRIVGSETVVNPQLTSLTGCGRAVCEVEEAVYYVWGGDPLSYTK